MLFAVQGGHPDTAAVLADAGADVDDMAPDGSSALIVAIDNRHYELAAWLLVRGADPNADGVGWTALHTAVLAHRPHFRVVPDPSPTGNLTSGALMEALLAAGADPNAASRERVRLATQTSPLYPTEGVTPFLLAAIAADVPLMRLLLAHGADTSVTTASGSTALMAAAEAATYAGQGAGSEADALDAVKLLLDTGVDVHAADEAGNTALHGAANRGANSVVELLLAQGARLDAANGRGWLPVTIAQGPIGHHRAVSRDLRAAPRSGRWRRAWTCPSVQPARSASCTTTRSSRTGNGPERALFPKFRLSGSVSVACGRCGSKQGLLRCGRHARPSRRRARPGW